ncbi:hypothetical protein FHX82_005798 [Amycolatopsis bartoniae]|nr:hypothetical protein [Amycolatopsis bartoniae]
MWSPLEIVELGPNRTHRSHEFLVSQIIRITKTNAVHRHDHIVDLPTKV